MTQHLNAEEVEEENCMQTFHIYSLFPILLVTAVNDNILIYRLTLQLKIFFHLQSYYAVL